MISFEVVTQTWERMCQTPVHRAPELVEQMNDEQPLTILLDAFVGSLADRPRLMA